MKEVKRMKKFMNPEIEIVKFSVQDVINESDIPEMIGDCVG